MGRRQTLMRMCLVFQNPSSHFNITVKQQFDQTSLIVRGNGSGNTVTIEPLTSHGFVSVKVLQIFSLPTVSWNWCSLFYKLSCCLVPLILHGVVQKWGDGRQAWVNSKLRGSLFSTLSLPFFIDFISLHTHTHTCCSVLLSSLSWHLSLLSLSLLPLTETRILNKQIMYRCSSLPHTFPGSVNWQTSAWPCLDFCSSSPVLCFLLSVPDAHAGMESTILMLLLMFL